MTHFLKRENTDDFFPFKHLKSHDRFSVFVVVVVVVVVFLNSDKEGTPHTYTTNTPT